MDKAELLDMIYRACYLFYGQFPAEAPTWVQIMANGNPDMLEEVAEIARDYDMWEETGE